MTPENAPSHFLDDEKWFQRGYERGRSLAEISHLLDFNIDGTPWNIEKFCKVCVPSHPKYIKGIKVGWVAYKLQQ